MEKNQKNTNASQRPYTGSGSSQTQRIQQLKSQDCGSKQTGNSGSSCAREPHSAQSGQQKSGQFRGQDASFRKPEGASQPEKENRNKVQAASNEDWEGGASRPAQEAQTPAVKKNVPPPEISEPETPDTRTIPSQAAGADRNNPKNAK